MFEEWQKEVDALMHSDPQFKTLYRHHKELDDKVRDAELGVLPLDDAALTGLKREKLRVKDQLTEIWDRHHRHSSPDSH